MLWINVSAVWTSIGTQRVWSAFASTILPLIFVQIGYILANVPNFMTDSVNLDIAQKLATKIDSEQTNMGLVSQSQDQRMNFTRNIKGGAETDCKIRNISDYSVSVNHEDVWKNEICKKEDDKNVNLTKLVPWRTITKEDLKTEIDRIYYEKYYYMPPRTKQCDDVKAPGLDYTLVTVLLDLRRENWPHFRRQFVKYLFYSVQMLNLHSPMVIYVDEQAVDFVRYHRQGKEHFTKIIPITIRDLEYYKYHDRISEVMSSDQFKRDHSMLHHPEGFSADYNVLMNSKLSMIFHASTRNYFSTNYFYWMDVGYGHGENVFPESCLWSPNAIMNKVDQVTYIELNPLKSLKSIDDLYKKFLPPFLNGAFFGGPAISIKRYYFLHKEIFEAFLADGKVDDDQTMAVACYFEKPLLFNIVQGWWYDAFTLFK